MAHLDGFPAIFEAAYTRVLRAKLGLVKEEESDRALAGNLLARLASNDVDYTIFFRRLCACAADPFDDADVASLFADPGAFQDWAEGWRRRTATEGLAPDARAAAMRRANPAFIPRNHRVEEAIEAAVARDDFAPFETLVKVLSQPFDDQPEVAHLAEPPGPEQLHYQTFCGT
jgi:uncharacterized protein YdiU (UPF0061 family)